jgi:hypothetical protein
MPRPKSTAPKKRNLTLTVSTETREKLAFISEATGVSISEMIEDYANKEAKRISKAAKKEVLSPDQIKLDV